MKRNGTKMELDSTEPIRLGFRLNQRRLRARLSSLATWRLLYYGLRRQCSLTQLPERT